MAFNLGQFFTGVFNSLENSLLQNPTDFETAKVVDKVIPGDVEILNITLTSLDQTRKMDLMGMAKAINIYEDLFVPSLVAEFQIQDIEDLQNNFGIKPGDYVQFSFRTPRTENTVELLFGIQSINNVQVKENLKLKTYTITAVSPETLRNSTFVINFKQKDSASRIVKRIFDDHIKTTKEVSVDPSKTIEDFPPISAIRPFQAINYLLKFSYSSKYNSNAFVFFENKRGYFFTTIEKLIEQGVKAQSKGNQFTDKEFFYDIASNEDTRNNGFRNIIAYNRLGINAFENASKISTIVSTYDFCRGDYIKTTKKITEESFEMLEGESAGIDPAFDSTYGRETTSVQFIPISSDCMPKEYGSLVTNRFMFANKLQQDSIQIYVYGDTELCVGDVIKCNFPNFSAVEKDQTKEETESGNYLITSLRHIILNTDRPSHMIAMECMRDRKK